VSATRSRLRRAGRGTAADGSIVTWSVAEGRRGSRWREVRVRDAAVVSSLLLELDPSGRFSHLELSTASGLLTLHPEGDGTLHGNAVEAGGLRHVVAIPWTSDDILIVAGSPTSRSAAARRADVPPGAEAARPKGVGFGVVVGLDLTVARRAIGRSERTTQLDADGLPGFGDGVTWPLELDA
jgi:hypothetical protein